MFKLCFSFQTLLNLRCFIKLHFRIIKTKVLCLRYAFLDLKTEFVSNA